jgi:hypothetical protein
VIGACANDVFEHDARVLEVHHPAGLLVDDPLNALQYSGLATTVFNHLGIKRYAAIAVLDIKCPNDIILRLDAHQFTRTESEG